jgi:hypothetical protein
MPIIIASRNFTAEFGSKRKGIEGGRKRVKSSSLSYGNLQFQIIIVLLTIQEILHLILGLVSLTTRR